MSMLVLYFIVALILSPFIARALVVVMDIGHPDTEDKFFAVVMGLLVAFFWPLALIGIFVYRIAFGNDRAK